MSSPINTSPSSNLSEAIEQLAFPGFQNLPLAPLEAYCHQLWEWNRNLNLTRHTTYDLFVRRDLLDSWQVAQLLQPGEKVLDVGTGGGVPGALVAILRPDVKVTLCDCVAKKIKALDAIIAEAKIPVETQVGMIQELVVQNRYDSLIMRAVGPIAKVAGWMRGRWDRFGRLLAVKGPKWVEERAEARHRGLLKGVELRRMVSYTMPDTHSQSVILQLRREVAGSIPAEADSETDTE